MNSWTLTTPGKWILTGEHAVLRGHPALIFPCTDHELTLTVTTSEHLSIHVDSLNAECVHDAAHACIKRACQLLNRPADTLTGRLRLRNTLPVGGGLGFSAALCVSIGRWLVKLGVLIDDQLQTFCTQLEDLFHGQSSGADIAALLCAKPMIFRQGVAPQPFTPIWVPNIQLTDTQTRANTATCVASIQALWKSDPNQAKALDAHMSACTDLAVDALLEPPSTGEAKLIQAINMACDCFSAWSLITPTMAQVMSTLKTHGARACKPTGAGLGGLILSL